MKTTVRGVPAKPPDEKAHWAGVRCRIGGPSEASLRASGITDDELVTLGSIERVGVWEVFGRRARAGELGMERA
jgi:hypothetical protein